MSLSIYAITVPVLQRGLGVLRTYVDKAEAHVQAQGWAPEDIIQARLQDDMLPFAGQIQRASDTAKAAMGRLAGATVPAFEDTEKTFAELADRIERTRAFIGSVGEAQFAGAAERAVELKFRAGAVTLRGDAFATQFLLPNFFFHVATAHAILRHKGVAVGKQDYLGPFH